MRPSRGVGESHLTAFSLPRTEFCTNTWANQAICLEERREGRREGGREYPTEQGSGGAPEGEACWQRWKENIQQEEQDTLQGVLGPTYKALQVARTSRTPIFQNATPKTPCALAPDAVTDLVLSTPYTPNTPNKASSCL